MERQKYSTRQICDAITDAHGLLSHAAKHLGCNIKTMYDRRDREEEIRTCIARARSGTLDDAERALYKAAKVGEGWAVRFMLKYLARCRGYIDSQHHEVSGSLDLKMYGVDAPIDDV